jgi:hypothetical protein
VAAEVVAVTMQREPLVVAVVLAELKQQQAQLK